jgi:hypothetical protein
MCQIRKDERPYVPARMKRTSSSSSSRRRRRK